MLGSWARRTGFWLLDGIRGGPIRRQYEDVASKMSSQDDSPDQLQILLDHAARTTPFYSRLPANDLQNLPVVTRTMYWNAFEDFQSNAFVGARLHFTTSSGSSGMPLTVGHDTAKRSRVIADILYFNDICGFRLGDSLMWLRPWATLPAKSRMERFAQNIIPVELIGMDDHVKNDVIRTLRRRRVSCVLGYSSALWSLARHIDEMGRAAEDFGLSVVMSDSESLLPSTKRQLAAAFGCPVVDRYANEENGLLACTQPDDDLFHLNRASYFFEFLKLDSDEPEEKGSLARIVVTDLYSYAMPMIRYDTGDLAIVADDGPGPARTLRSIEGRRADVIYDVLGRELSSTTIGTLMDEFADVARYQLIQESASAYRLRLCGTESARIERALEAKFVTALGSTARVAVEFVDDIPSGRNGKFRTTICNYVPHGGDASSSAGDVVA